MWRPILAIVSITLVYSGVVLGVAYWTSGRQFRLFGMKWWMRKWFKKGGGK